jgi:predicted enzyme related to lactoylglutathione lyase
VSGTWALGRSPASEPGFLVYAMVDSVAATLDVIVANGGEIVQSIGADAHEITARFRDPAGNVIGLHQQPAGRSAALRSNAADMVAPRGCIVADSLICL